MALLANAARIFVKPQLFLCFRRYHSTPFSELQFVSHWQTAGLCAVLSGLFPRIFVIVFLLLRSFSGYQRHTTAQNQHAAQPAATRKSAVTISFFKH
ncbi:MAG TPA: hypothetical protein H9832_04740 [Candidatus Agathobaculum merdavium]|nr:hypothetical protein [Candidatus Agathobaculum merdavium]